MKSFQIAQPVEKRTMMRLEFPCSLHAARAAGMELREFLAGQSVSAAELDAWELAAVEAANNAALYAPESRRGLALSIEASVSAKSVEVRITDHTDGFELPDSTELPDLESEGGRGLFLIRTLTDSIDYLRGRNGNILAMSKARDQAAKARPIPTVAELESELSLLTEELAASYESLSAIFSFTSTFSNAEDPLALVEPWMKELARVTSAAWYAFFVASPDGRTLTLASGSGPEIPAKIQVPSRGEPAPDGCAIGLAVWSRQDVWFDASMPLEPVMHFPDN